MSQYSNAVLALPGVVSYWRLGELLGSSTAVDEKSAAPGTYDGPPTLEQAGLIFGDGDFSVLFPNDAQKRVNDGSSSALNITTSALVIGARIKITGGAGTYRQIVCKASGTPSSARKYGLYVDGAGNKLGFEVKTTGGHVDYVDGPALSADIQYSVAGVYNGTDVRLYVNGALVGTPQALTGTVVDQPTSNCLIGAFSDGVNSPFYGVIDEVFIGSSEVSASALLSLHSEAQAAGTARQFVVVPIGAASGAVPYFDSTTVPRWQHLAIGATGDVLQVAAGLPSWGTPDWNNTTAQLKRGNTAGLPAPLASGQVYIDTQVSRAYVGV